MNRMIFFILASVLSLSFFTFTEATAEEKIWVSSTNAKLKADHSAASETVTRVAVGSELLVLSFENRWYHVSTVSGKKGWIYRGKVSNHPPDIQEQKKRMPWVRHLAIWGAAVSGQMRLMVQEVFAACLRRQKNMHEKAEN